MDSANRKLVIALLLIVAVAGGYFVLAKSGKGPSGISSLIEGRTQQAQVKTADLDSTLAAGLPANAFAYFEFDSSSPAAAKLLKSPWAGAQIEMMASRSANASRPALMEALEKVGINLERPDTLMTLFSRLAGFIAPLEEQGAPPAIGLVFKGAAGSDLPTKLSSLKEELAKSGKAVSELGESAISGFAVETGKAAEAPAGAGKSGSTAFVGWKGDLGAVSTSKTLLGKVLRGEGKLPEMLSEESFGRATKGFPGKDVRLGTAYVDFSRALAALEQAPDTRDLQKLKEGFPFMAMAAAASVSAEGVQEQDIRLLFDPQKKEWLEVFHSSPAEAMVKLLGERPLVFISLDGGTLRSIKNRSGAAAQAPQLAMLDQLDRISISARVAPVGQSMLPVPDLMIAVEAKNSGKIKDEIEAMVGAALGGALGASGTGFPAKMGWQQKTVNGMTVKSLLTPFGIGVFLAAVDQMVIITSSQGLMSQVLARDDSKQGFFKSLSPQARTGLADRPTVANFYLDYRELALFLENMGGMLSMYVPQNADAKQFLDPKRIQAMKEMGVLHAALYQEPEALLVQAVVERGGPVN